MGKSRAYGQYGVERPLQCLVFLHGGCLGRLRLYHQHHSDLCLDYDYRAYSVFYTLGSIMAMQVPFVGFNVIKQAESLGSHGVFIGLQGKSDVELVQTDL